MASHQRNRRRQQKRKRRDGCSGKIRYTEGKSASRGASKLMIDCNLDRASVYLCDVCNHLHVSSQVRDSALIVLDRE